MAESYVAVARLKVGHKEYIEPGEPVKKSDVDDLDHLVASGTVMEKEAYKAAFPEAAEGANQAFGSPSNLEQITGTELQMNPPEEGDEVAEARPQAPNPADPPVVDGAPTPGDGSDSSGQDFEEDDASS